VATYSAKMADSQFSYQFDLDGPQIDGLVVTKIEVVERLSRPYSCRVSLESPSVLPASLLGTAGGLVVTAPTGTLRAPGLVLGLAQDDLSVSAAETRIPYVIEISPKLSSLAYSSGSTIYGSDNAVKVDDLIKSKLHSIRHNINFVSAMPQRDFVAQHNEDDLNFIQRMTEQYGVFYFFEFADDGETVKFIDSNELAPELSLNGANEIAYNRNFGLDSTTAPVVRSFTSRAAATFGAVVVRDYDPGRPEVIEKQAPVTQGTSGQRVDFGGLVETVDEERRYLANVRAQELQASREIFTGICNLPQLRPGLKFKLTGRRL